MVMQTPQPNLPNGSSSSASIETSLKSSQTLKNRSSTNSSDDKPRHHHSHISYDRPAKHGSASQQSRASARWRRHGKRWKLCGRIFAVLAFVSCLLNLVSFHSLDRQWNAADRWHPSHQLPQSKGNGQRARQMPIAASKNSMDRQHDGLQWQGLEQSHALNDTNSHRIRTYTATSNATFYGFVFRDLSARILSRKIAHSSVLVVTDPQDSTTTQPDESGSARHKIGPCIASEAQRQGHDVYNLASLPMSRHSTVDEWWQSFDDGGGVSAKRPDWMLLSVFDPLRFGTEDAAVLGATTFLKQATATYVVFRVSAVFSDDVDDDDAGDDNRTQQYHGVRAAQLLQSMGYKVQILSMSHAPTNRTDPQDTILVRPDIAHDEKLDVRLPRYGPNTLLASKQDVERFLERGLAWTQEASATMPASSQPKPYTYFRAYLFATQGLDLAIPSQREHLNLTKLLYTVSSKSNNGPQVGSSNGMVDLTRPVPYNTCQKHELKMKGAQKMAGLHAEDSRLLRWSPSKRTWYTGCAGPDQRRVQDVWDEWQKKEKRPRRPSDALGTDGNGTFAIPRDEISIDDSKPMIWFDGPTADESEAVCIRCPTASASTGVLKTHSSDQQIAVCETHIQRHDVAINLKRHSHKRRLGVLPKKNQPMTISQYRTKSAMTTKKSSSKGNNNSLLFIMIDPISRGMFRRFLPGTLSWLRSPDSGFVEFTNYTAVGDNSGPNQAALYTGESLDDRNSISSHNQRDATKWIWDELRQSRYKYTTLKAEDGCVLNSNMVQSIKPNVTHGDALHHMFCFDYQRPNCIGSIPAPLHLMKYATKFIQSYQSSELIQQPPWAAFLSFIDSHEDTGMLSGTLDAPLRTFLQSTRMQLNRRGAWDDLTVVLVSDHGLHYGPYFQTYEGQVERIQPILHIKLPKHIQEQAQTQARQTILDNRHKHTTPFDVHQTLLDVLLNQHKNENDTETEEELNQVDYNSHSRHDGVPPPDRNTDGRIAMHGQSLLLPLPQARDECHTTQAIPQKYCDLIEANATTRKRMALESPTPPSMMSFYADIPQHQRPQLNFTARLPSNQRAIVTEGCRCAGKVGDWYSCSKHPWGEDVNVIVDRITPFMLVDCPGKPLHLETRVIGLDVLRARKQQLPPAHQDNMVNILFLEIDSASASYADRFFPKTRSFLESYRMQRLQQAPLSSTGPNTRDEHHNNGSDRDNDDDTDDDDDDDDPYSYKCKGSICGVDLSSHVSIYGPNSIPNQVAALSGCISMPSNGTDKCNGQLLESFREGHVCNDEHSVVRDLVMYRKRPYLDETVWCPQPLQTKYNGLPWLFDVGMNNAYITYFGEEFCFEGSPYVTQNNLFPSFQIDYRPHRTFCRLAERKIELLNLTGITKFQRWGVEDSNEICLDGNEGIEKAHISIEALRQMWTVYSSSPKLAFLNAIAAHDYTPDWARVSLRAERYDDHVVSLLRSIIEDATSSNSPTMIIVRADHGLQFGPLAVDYSTQVEHSRPWTEMLVTENIAGLSKKALYANQRRLVTGHDLYRTMRALMSRFGPGAIEQPTPSTSYEPGIPSWSYNLLTQDIPEDRSCEDARIDEYSCRETSVKAGFGICNRFDKTQRRFCE